LWGSRLKMRQANNKDPNKGPGHLVEEEKGEAKEPMEDRVFKRSKSWLVEGGFKKKSVGPDRKKTGQMINGAGKERLWKRKEKFIDRRRQDYCKEVFQGGGSVGNQWERRPELGPRGGGSHGGSSELGRDESLNAFHR